MSKLIAPATVALAALALVQCSPKPATAPEAPKTVNYGYDIAIAVSPAAAAKLMATKDGLIITALYYGNPTTQTASLADAKDGTIHMNTDKLELEGKDQGVHMTGEGVDPVRAKSITEQKPLVLLNVYSGHDGKTDKTLTCTDFQDYVSVAQASKITIKCDVT